MLISVNPFKQLPYFTDREVDLYQGAVSNIHATKAAGLAAAWLHLPTYQFQDLFASLDLDGETVVYKMLLINR